MTAQKAKNMNNEEYVRRVVALEARIERTFPYPPGEYDDNEGEWKRMHWLRERAKRRILELPRRWRACAQAVPA